jgi:hypothetical protein
MASVGLWLVLGAGLTPAADGTWTNCNGGNWGDPLNWAGGLVADGPGSTANFTTVDLVFNNPVISLDASRRRARVNSPTLPARSI